MLSLLLIARNTFNSIEYYFELIVQILKYPNSNLQSNYEMISLLRYSLQQQTCRRISSRFRKMRVTDITEDAVKIEFFFGNFFVT